MVSRPIRALVFCFTAISAMGSLFSCRRTAPEDEISLPLTPPLSRSIIGYGVVNANYTRILDKSGDNGNSIGFLRKGSIVEILERRPVLNGEKSEIWVLASGNYTGWLKENELRVYSSKAQAATASQSIPQ
jgi:hypothetical protein